MIQDDVQVLDWLNCGFYGLDINSNFIRDVLPCFVDIFNLVDVKSAGIWSKLLPDISVDLHLEFSKAVFHSLEESVLVGSGTSVNEPGNSLKADSDIDDLDLKLFSRSIVESLVLHENHVSDLKTANEIFDRWSKVASTGPYILNESDFIWVNIECFCEPSVIKFNDFFFEKDMFLWCVENLDTKHDEA